MLYYTNLPLSWVHSDKKWLDMFIGKGMNPELGFDEISLALPLSWHKDTAAYIKDSGLRCVSHLPFFAGPPGARDKKIRQEVTSVLQKAAELASVYDADHMVGHPAFLAETDALPQEMLPRPSLEGCPACQPVSAMLPVDPVPQAWWVENSLESWQKVLEASDARLYLENTYDLSPLPVVSVIEGLWATDNYSGRVGMCFDIGHWFSFAGGSRRHNLDEWLEAVGPFLRHLHLHDNLGLADQHLGLGYGRIPLEMFFSALLARGLKPDFTLSRTMFLLWSSR